MSLLDRIVGIFGGAEEPAPEYRPQLTDGDDPPDTSPRGMQYSKSPVIDRWSYHPGRALTVGKLFATYNLAEDGWPEDQCDLFEDRIEADSQLRHLSEQRRDAVALKEKIVVPGGDDAASVEAAKLLSNALDDVPHLVKTLEHQASYFGPGWSATEVDWQLVDGLVVPVRFVDVPCRRFRFDDLDNYKLRTMGEPLGVDLLPGKWWITQRAGRVKAKSGLHRTGALISHLKTTTLRDWLIFCDRYGLPYVYAKYGDTLPDEERPILEKAVKSIGSDGWAILHEAAEIVVSETRRTGSADEVHGALTRYLDDQLSKLYQGGSLTSSTGSGSSSYALGVVHQTSQFSIIKGDALRIGLSFADSIGRAFVKFNGMAAKPPAMTLQVSPEMSLPDWARLFKDALEMGLALDERQVRTTLKLKPATGPAVILPPNSANAENPGETDDDAAAENP